MTELKKWLQQIFQDVDGCYSSKRTVAFMAFFFMLACGIVNLLGGAIVAEFIFEGMMWIVLGGFGISAVEYVKDVMKARAENPKG